MDKNQAYAPGSNRCVPRHLAFQCAKHQPGFSKKVHQEMGPHARSENPEQQRRRFDIEGSWQVVQSCSGHTSYNGRCSHGMNLGDSLLSPLAIEGYADEAKSH